MDQKLAKAVCANAEILRSRPRFNVFAWDTSATLAAKLAGWYSWATKLRQRIGGVGR